MEDDEIRVKLVTYGGGEKYKSLTGKRGEERDLVITKYSRYLPYITTIVCQCHTFFSVVSDFHYQMEAAR
jgi:hypothetical protein